MSNIHDYYHHPIAVTKRISETKDVGDKSVKIISYFGDVTAAVDLMACSDVWRRTDAMLRQTYARSSP